MINICNLCAAYQIGCYTLNELREFQTEYVTFILKPQKKYLLRVDVTQHLKSLSLYADSLFSGKNTISECNLSKHDFDYLEHSRYTVPIQSSIPIQSKVFKINREKNIFIANVHFEDILGNEYIIGRFKLQKITAL